MARVNRPNPAIPFVFLHGTDGYVITDISTAITWDHKHFRTSEFGFTDGGTRITVARGTDVEGIYMIYVSAGAVKKAGNPTEFILQFYKNGSACDCGKTHGSIGAGTEHGNAILIIAVYLHVGDYLEIYASVDAVSATVEEDTCRWIISALPMKGWNNSSGGSLRQRGEVDR